MAGPGGKKARIWGGVQATGLPQILISIVLMRGVDELVRWAKTISLLIASKIQASKISSVKAQGQGIRVQRSV